jgi:hypothetical protein
MKLKDDFKLFQLFIECGKSRLNPATYERISALFLADTKVEMFKLPSEITPYLKTCPKAKKEVISRAIMWDGRKPKHWFWEDVKLVTIH